MEKGKSVFDHFKCLNGSPKLRLSGGTISRNFRLGYYSMFKVGVWSKKRNGKCTGMLLTATIRTDLNRGFIIIKCYFRDKLKCRVILLFNRDMPKR